MTTSDARKRLAERNAATQADTSVEAVAMAEGEFAAVVERVMYDEGWVCNPADHEDLPAPGECINCDTERHRLGYRLHAALADALNGAGVTGGGA